MCQNLTFVQLTVFRDIEKTLIFGELKLIPKIIKIHKTLILHFRQYHHTNMLCKCHIRKLRRF